MQQHWLPAARSAPHKALACRHGVCQQDSRQGQTQRHQPITRAINQHQRPSLHIAHTSGLATEEEDAARTAEYNHRMSQQMGWDPNKVFDYQYDRGLYFHEVIPNLMCGTMPRNVSDLDYLHYHENINTVLNLQQNEDFHYWKVDFHSIYHRGVSHGMDVVRRPAVDFDPHSLRRVLPSAVKVVHEALQEGRKVYVHCTAGLGRAPAVCIAYVYWFGGAPSCPLDLDDAYDHVTSIRPCGPKRDAVRAATFDLLDHRDFDTFFHLPPDAFAFLNDQDRQNVQQRVLACGD